MDVDQSIFKTYDIRGIWEKDLHPELAAAIGKAFVTSLKPKRVVVGRDVRLSGPQLFDGLVRGIRAMGVDVVDIGVVTSDALYFAVGKYHFDGGVIVTASHNPPEWNGFKFMQGNLSALFGDGIQQLAAIINRDSFAPLAAQAGQFETLDITDDYVNQVLSFSSGAARRQLSVVVDPGNGAAGRFLPAIMDKLGVTWQAINLKLDGTFPGRNPNPLGAGALDELKRQVVANRADVGVAFDADADRMFLVDERGQRVLGDVLTAVLAQYFLQRNPGATVVYNLICSHAVPETIARAGGRPVRVRVGHGFMKAAMREHQAVFGGEVSGHFFFRDLYSFDSGLAAMVVSLDLLRHSDRSLSELAAAVDTYAHDAEINSKVEDVPGVLQKIKSRYADGKIDETDGVTVEYPDWWFNVRPSNTEPLLRLSVEAKTKAEMERRRDEILQIIRG